MRRAAIILISIFCLMSIAKSQVAPLHKKKYFYKPSGNVQDTVNGYAYAVLADNILYVSGFVGNGNMENQLKSIYSKFHDVLNYYNIQPQHIVKETGFAMDLDSIKANNHVRREIYKGDFPACTWVQISRLWSTRPGRAHVEIEIIAHVPNKNNRKKNR